MNKIYVGSFIKKNGELIAIVEVENRNTVNSAAERKVNKDKNGNFVVINKEKFYFEFPELEVNYSKNGIEYLSEKVNAHHTVKNFAE